MAQTTDLVKGLCGWLLCSVSGRLTCLVVGYLSNRLAGCLVDWITDRLLDGWLTDRMVDRLNK